MKCYSRPDHHCKVTLPKQLRVKDTRGFRLNMEALHRVTEQEFFDKGLLLVAMVKAGVDPAVLPTRTWSSQPRKST